LNIFEYFQTFSNVFAHFFKKSPKSAPKKIRQTFSQLNKKAILMALPALRSFSEAGWTKAGLLWRDMLHASQDTTFIFNQKRCYPPSKIQKFKIF